MLTCNLKYSGRDGVTILPVDALCMWLEADHIFIVCQRQRGQEPVGVLVLWRQILKRKFAFNNATDIWTNIVLFTASIISLTEVWV